MIVIEENNKTDGIGGTFNEHFGINNMKIFEGDILLTKFVFFFFF